MIETNIQQEALKYFKIKDLGLFISRIISTTIIIAAILSLIFLLWGGLNWIMSQGEKAKYEEARNRITAALAGLALIVVVWLLWRLGLYFLGVGKIVNNKVIFTLF